MRRWYNISVLCQQNLHVIIVLYYYRDIIDYRDNMTVTYLDIGFAIIAQPYKVDKHMWSREWERGERRKRKQSLL